MLTVSCMEMFFCNDVKEVIVHILHCLKYVFACFFCHRCFTLYVTYHINFLYMKLWIQNFRIYSNKGLTMMFWKVCTAEQKCVSDFRIYSNFPDRKSFNELQQLDWCLIVIWILVLGLPDWLYYLHETFISFCYFTFYLSLRGHKKATEGRLTKNQK